MALNFQLGSQVTVIKADGLTSDFTVTGLVEDQQGIVTLTFEETTGET